MKALTIYQPWASLIMVGAKPYEFRSWNPRTRGPSYAALIGQRIVIHSSTRKIVPYERDDLITVLERGGESAAETCLHADLALPVLRQALPFGCALGTAILGEPRNGLEIAEEFGVPRANDSDRHDHANWGWPMLDIEVWPEPVPMRGFQGFWNMPTPESLGL